MGCESEVMMSVWGYILAIFFIVAPSVATGVFLNWQLVKDAWNRCKKRTKDFLIAKEINSASILLFIASVLIVLALCFFGSDIYEIYVELHKQIDEKGQTADDYRGIAIRYFGVVAGAGAIIGYIVAIARNITANKQNRIAGEQNKINDRARITESMGQAITQIGALNGEKPNIEVRLGGLYSLQRIMQDSEENELPVVKILYAYVRENVTRDKKGLSEKEGIDGYISYKLPEDIQAALNIISQFNKEWRKQGKEIPLHSQLDFMHTNFSNYYLVDMDFSYANLWYADFSNADLFAADLSNADFFQANLSNANLEVACLSNAQLHHADLSGVSLNCAKAINTDFSGANLSEASLHHVDLSTAKGLEQWNINQANGNKKTKLPEGLTHPQKWIDQDPDKD